MALDCTPCEQLRVLWLQLCLPRTDTSNGRHGKRVNPKRRVGVAFASVLPR